MTIVDQASQVMDLVKAAGASGDLIVDQGESLSLKANEGELEIGALRGGTGFVHYATVEGTYKRARAHA